VADASAVGLWRRIDLAERSLCLRINRGCHRARVRSLFVVASRLGDGVFWYALMASLALIGGDAGARAALQMAVAGLVGTALYRSLKERLVRERPFVSHAGILRGTAPLDRYSFPSGHTLHAVCFSAIAISSYPGLLGCSCRLRCCCGVAGRPRPALPDGRGAGAVLGALLATTATRFWPI
jgi:undecaprenyl-diphosphatase